MPRYEYKVVPAPTKGLKAKGVKGAEARFSHALEEVMNRLASDGWEYQRAETLPSTERAGLTGTTTEWRNMLVFRRLRENAAEEPKPELLPPPSASAEPPRHAPKAPAAIRPINTPNADVSERKEPMAPSAKSSPVPESEPALNEKNTKARITPFSTGRKTTNSDT